MNSRTRAITLAAAAAYLAMTAALAADPATFMPPNQYGAAHKIVPPAVSSHNAGVTPETAAAADVAAFNRHVTLWRSFDVPGAVNGMSPTSINDLGEITGYYFDSNNFEHGFLRKANGRIVPFDPPNVGFPFTYAGTTPTDINNEGDIVGNYQDAAGATHGFIRSAQGTYTMVDDPNPSPPNTYAQAINDWGLIVGFWVDSQGNTHGFVRQLDGSFIPFEPTGAVSSQGYHINDLGETAGDWSDTITSHGMLRYPGGKLVTFDAPNSVVTFGGLGQALNLEGSFAGTYFPAVGNAHGYVRYANGHFAEFTVPNGDSTWSQSLNLLGTGVGFSFESTGAVDGWVRFSDGTVITVDAPVAGQLGTAAVAINDYNEFTGGWTDAQGNQHGFVAVAVP
jgi:hypothetical protein